MGRIVHSGSSRLGHRAGAQSSGVVARIIVKRFHVAREGVLAYFLIFGGNRVGLELMRCPKGRLGQCWPNGAG